MLPTSISGSLFPIPTTKGALPNDLLRDQPGNPTERCATSGSSLVRARLFSIA